MADEHELWELIAAPIKAMNEAEAAGASRFVELFLDYALEAPPRANAARTGAPEAAAAPRLREVRFDVMGAGADGEAVPHQLSVPLAQMLPFGGVCIDQATLTFGLSLSTAGAAAAPGGRFRGRLAQTQGGQGSDANFHVEMKLRQMDMPQGMMDLMQQTQGVVRTVTSAPIDPDPVDPPPPPPPPPALTDLGLFHAAVLEVQLKSPSASVVLDIAPRDGLRAPLSMAFAPSPAGSYRIEQSKAPMELKELSRVTINLRDLTPQAVEMLAASRLGLLITGQSLDERSGQTVQLSMLVSLQSPTRPREPRT